jgi:extracellular elastinolytic metalloproteinase
MFLMLPTKYSMYKRLLTSVVVLTFSSPWGTNDPTKGGRTLETNPYDSAGSLFTWQGDGRPTYTTTRGNNSIAQANYEGDNDYLNDYRPDAPRANFNYDLSLTETNPKKYAAALVTQLFYTANMYHDLL